MRILFATDQYLPTPGGISIVTQRISTALAKKGHSVSIIAPSIEWKYNQELINNVTIYRLQSVLIHKTKQLRLSPTFLYAEKIKKIINNFKPDIIHIETPFMIANETLKIAKDQNIPVVATCHIMPENISGSLSFLPQKIGRIIGSQYMKQIIKVFNQADLLTAPTPIGTAILKAYNIQKPAIALSNGIDLDQFRQPNQEEKDKLLKKFKFPPVPLILYIGRFDKEKKVDVLIRSLKYIKNSQPYHVILEGKGQQELYLQNLVKKLDLQDKVTFIGYVEEHELPVLYSLSTVFVMPSTAELQSLVTMEAMSLGLPVIGAKAGALPYLIKNGKNGYLFEPDDPADLGPKLQLILGDPVLQKNMSRESLTLIKEHNINNIILKMESIYTDLINEKKSS